MSGKEYTAKTIEEALEKALNEMMLTRDDIEYEVITQPSKGFLGFGQRDAVVRVRKKMVEELKDIIACIKEEREEEKEFLPKFESKKATLSSKNSSAEPQRETEETMAADQAGAAEQQDSQAARMADRETDDRMRKDSEHFSQAAKDNSAESEAETMEKKETGQETAEKIAVTDAVSGAQEVSRKENSKEAAEETVQKAVDRQDALECAAEKGKAFLQKIFLEMKLDVKIETQEKSGYLLFDLKGENLGILIGRRGDTLDALQFLLNLVINEKNMPKVKGIIDVENYRAKREETLIALSRKLAAKAKRTGQKVVLEPMNPQERRIIHMALQNDHRVTTYSEGEEPYRKVVIVPEENTREQGGKNRDRREIH